HLLKIAADGATFADGAKPATRESVAALIDELLHDENRAGWRNAMIGERSSMYDSLVNTLGGQFSGRVLGLLLTPTWKLEAADLLSYGSRMVDSADATDYQAARSMTPHVSGIHTGGLRDYAKMMTGILLPSLDRALMIHFRSIALRRLAATA